METEKTDEHPEKMPLTWGAVRRLMALAKPYWKLLASAGLLMLISTGVSLYLPLAARKELDHVLQTRQIASLDRLAFQLIGLLLVSTVLGFGEYLMVAFAGNKIVTGLRAKLFAHLQSLPVSFFDRTRSGDLTSRLSNDVTLLQETLTGDVVRLVGNLVTLIGGLSLALLIDWRLTGVVVSLLASVLAVLIFCGMRLRKLTRESLDALSATMGTMTESLANIRLVKAFAREAHENAKADEKLQSVFRLGMRASVFEGAIGTFAGVGFTLVLLGVIWYGGRSVLMGQISAGSLLAFFMTIMIISGPMASLASLYGRLQRALGAADRLFMILDDTPETPDALDALPFPEGTGRVAFENLEFAYHPETPVLNGLSAEIPAGKVTALVGASGAGKTTLALLLYRFYEPTGGCIRIEGVPIDHIQRQALRENIGLVPQEPILFNGSIRENIRYGRLEATDSEVEIAAQAANVEEFVIGLPKGYDTVLGERGITLSGGQRQRVAIARAILKDPRILVLDEATSALDTQSERLVQEALERLMRGRTTLVIAHRLTTIRNADQIVVLDAGQVVERGTHDELLEANGRYRLLHGLNV